MHSGLHLTTALCLLLHLLTGHAATLVLPDEPNDDVVGELRVTRVTGEDTLLDIARRHDLGYTEITAANAKVDPWVPGQGKVVLLPTRFILPAGERSGLVINLAQMRLFYFPPPQRGEKPVVITHPIGVGVEYGSTPLGSTTIVDRAVDPTWVPPESVRSRWAAEGIDLPTSVPPGPGNPLGTHALYLGFAGYLIHGTDRPWGIGMRVSSGCIRMYPEDIAALFALVPVGTPVRIVDQPFAVGRLHGSAFVQVFPRPHDEEGGDALDIVDHTPLIRALTRRIPRGEVDWDRVMQVAQQRLGVPLPVGPRAPSLEVLLERAPWVEQ
ncbi:MAG TPA: L,D-transpeptidase family protein [Burkholderiales bacterium]|nr:L,D-transpeptidase family protein [Burkholderiales bacterium]